jgi:hypothetical protein
MIACPECGFENPEGSKFCENCGIELAPSSPAKGEEIEEKALAQPVQPSQQITVTTGPPSSGLAIASLVLGILGWVFLPIIGHALAVIFGHMAKSEIRNSGGQLGGEGMATAGLVLGYSGLGIACLATILIILLPMLGISLCGICSIPLIMMTPSP